MKKKTKTIVLLSYEASCISYFIYTPLMGSEFKQFWGFWFKKRTIVRCLHVFINHPHVSKDDSLHTNSFFLRKKEHLTKPHLKLRHIKHPKPPFLTNTASCVYLFIFILPQIKDWIISSFHAGDFLTVSDCVIHLGGSILIHEGCSFSFIQVGGGVSSVVVRMKQKQKSLTNSSHFELYVKRSVGFHSRRNEESGINAFSSRILTQE